MTPKTIFLTLAGSQAHGTARAGSDVDVRGVCVAPLAVRVSLFNRFEQHEGPIEEAIWNDVVLPALRRHETASQGMQVKVETVAFDVAKFLTLCAQANPNALEVLFADERDWLFETPAWRTLWNVRERFLTKKAQATTQGYAMAQLKRIKTHRGWLLSPPAAPPTREAFGLPENGTLNADDRNRLEESLADKLRDYRLDDLEMPNATRVAVMERLRAFWFDVNGIEDEDRLRDVAAQALTLPASLVEALRAERRYRAARRHWDEYQGWLANRNPRRAELEKRFGYDTKHASHLIRLLRMGVEVLEEGVFRVRRTDAAELLAIRDGALTYDALLEAAEALQARVRAAAGRSSLPADVDHAWVDALAFEVLRSP